jgi:transposase InsO family protein
MGCHQPVCEEDFAEKTSLYLATAIDCFSKAVLGWAVDDRYPASLVIAALDMAAGRIELPEGAIFHSDRGSQYQCHLVNVVAA